MVSNVIEAPVCAGFGGKAEDQNAAGSDFMSVILSMFAGQPLSSEVAPEAVDDAPAASQVEQPVAGTAPVQPDTLELVMPQTAADIDGKTAAQDAAPEGRLAAPADGLEAQPAQTDEQDVVQALKDLTADQRTTVVLPEAAKANGENEASLVAHRVSSTGKNAQTREVLPRSVGLEVQAEDAVTPAQPQATAAPDGAEDVDSPAARTQSVPGVAAEAASAQAEAVIVPQGQDRRPANDLSGRPVRDAGGVVHAQAERETSRPVQAATQTEGDQSDFLAFTNPDTAPSADPGTAANADAPRDFGMEMRAQHASDAAVQNAGLLPGQGVGQNQPEAANHSTVARLAMDPAVAENVVKQVVREVTLHTVGETTTLSIRLDPPELGTLRINVSSQSGTLNTQIESPHAAVRAMLETHIPALREALSSAGIEVSNFSVSSGLDFRQQAQGQQQAWRPSRLAPAVEYAGTTADQPVYAAASRVVPGPSAGYSWLA